MRSSPFGLGQQFRLSQAVVELRSFTVSELAELTEVPENTIYSFLSAIGDENLRSEKLPSGGRGRPRKRYWLTQAGISLLFNLNSRLLGELRNQSSNANSSLESLRDKIVALPINDKQVLLDILQKMVLETTSESQVRYAPVSDNKTSLGLDAAGNLSGWLRAEQERGSPVDAKIVARSFPEVELIRRCANNDEKAWEEFVSRYHKVIGLAIGRQMRRFGDDSGTVVDDLIQETYLKLTSRNFQGLLEFATKHPNAIIGYIKVIAVNVTHDYHKAYKARQETFNERTADDFHKELTTYVVGKSKEEAVATETLIRQIDDILEVSSISQVHERDRNIFWLYYQNGLSPGEIGALPTVKLGRIQVEGVILRVTRLIRDIMFGAAPENFEELEELALQEDLR